MTMLLRRPVHITKHLAPASSDATDENTGTIAPRYESEPFRYLLLV